MSKDDSTVFLRKIASVACEAAINAAKAPSSLEVAVREISAALEEALLAQNTCVSELNCVCIALRVNKFRFPKWWLADFVPANLSDLSTIPCTDEHSHRAALFRGVAAVLTPMKTELGEDEARGAELLFDWIDKQGYLPGIEY